MVEVVLKSWVTVLSRLIATISAYQAVLLGAAFLITLGVLGLLLDAWLPGLSRPLDFLINQKTLIGILAYGLILGLVGFFLFIATRLGITTSSTSKLRELEDELQTRISVVRKEIEAIHEDRKNAIPEQHIKTDLKRIAEEYFKEETFQKFEVDIENKYGTTINVGAKVNSLRTKVEDSIYSLNQQVSKQRNNANINMLLGLIFSSSGIIVMGYFIWYYFQNERSFSGDITAYVVSFFPKLTFVILIETVAFFFLNLYREDRNMIRYFRNEITNLEAKYLSVEAAARFEDKQALSKILLILANTERNFTIRKGERLIVEALREEDNRLFDKTVEKILGVVDAVSRKSAQKTQT